jgi:hypothetical protein
MRTEDGRPAAVVANGGDAVGRQASTSVDTGAGLPRFRRVCRRRSTARVAGAGVAVVAVLFAAGCLMGESDTAHTAPARPSSSTVSPPTGTEPIDMATWTTYPSEQYGFEVGHPPNWTVIPASRSWRAADAGNPLSPAHDTFRSPSDDVRVSVWQVPLDRGTGIDSIDDVAAWVEEDCEVSGNTPCTGVEDRAVELCLEKWDCHPGLLVPFRNDVQAFFSAGIYDAGAMTVVAVWRSESAPAVAPYGGSRRLLEAVLSTMAVWPASTPLDERYCYGHPPTGLDCQASG